ncbi:hypothetical protein [Ursidibacter sp. B-7004-1]
MKTQTHITREERILRMVLMNGSFSEREGVFELNITSGRNDINRVMRKLGIQLKREWEETADGYGKYYRYSIVDKSQAYKLMTYYNAKATARGGEPLSVAETKAILSRYEGDI